MLNCIFRTRPLRGESLWTQARLSDSNDDDNKSGNDDNDDDGSDNDDDDEDEDEDDDDEDDSEPVARPSTPAWFALAE